MSNQAISEQLIEGSGRMRMQKLISVLVLLAISLLPIQDANAVNIAQFDGLFRTYTVLGSPKHVVVETAGKVWFTAPNADAIGLLSITEVTSQVAEYSTRYFPTGDGSKPYDLALHDGVIWFTLAGGDALGKLTIATETLTYYSLPPNSGPRGLAINTSDNTIWCVTNAGNTLIRFDPASETIEEFQYPVVNAGLEDLAFNGSGALWMTATARNEVRQFDLNTMAFQIPIPTGSSGGAPVTVVIDALNYPWVTFSSLGEIGRYAPGTLALWRRFAAPLNDGEPTGLHIEGDSFSQQIWYTLRAAGAVGYFHTRNSGQLMTPHLNFPLPGSNSAPWGITVGSGNVAWIADSGANQLVEWRPPYFEAIYLPAITR